MKAAADQGRPVLRVDDDVTALRDQAVSRLRLELVKEAEAGDTHAAAMILNSAAEALAAGVLPSAEIATYLAKALKCAIGRPSKAAIALGLARKGRPKENPFRLQYRIFKRFEALRQSGLLRGCDARDDGSAMAEVAAEFKISARHARRHIEAFSQFDRQLSEMVENVTEAKKPAD